jgi:uncharacterized protein (TIGR03437 family)
VVQKIERAGTATSLAISGGQMIANVTVAPPGSGSPGGAVRFLDATGGTPVATAALNGPTATAPLAATADALVAVYAGDDNFLGSISSTVALLSVGNAASYASAVFAPEELVALFGPDLATTTVSAGDGPADSLAGTTVTIVDGAGKSRTAPLLFISPAQAAALLPSGMAPGPATLTVRSAARTMAVSITITGVSPGLFTADSSGRGAPAGQVVRVRGGVQDDPEPASDGIDLGDAAADVYLVLYATGVRNAASPPVCTIAGRPAAVVFSGAQPAFPGLDQVNVLVPVGLKGMGSATLTLTADGVASNPVTLSIR